MLRMFAAENPSNWDDYLPFLLMAYRATNKSTGCTPNLVFLQREISCPLDLMVGQPPNMLNDVCPVQYIEWVKSAMTITHQFVFQTLGIAAKRQKFYYDKGLKPRKYRKGDWVWRWYPPYANQKLKLGWTGPYLVVDRISDTTYSIQKAADRPILNVHVDHIKSYQGEFPPANWLPEDETSNQKEGSLNEAIHPNNIDPDEVSDQSEILDNETTDVNQSTLNEQSNQNDITIQGENRDTHARAWLTTNQTVCKKITSEIPTIRSRRERPVKPRHCWSPS